MKALRSHCRSASALPGIAIALCVAFGGVADAAPRAVGHVTGELIGPRLVGDEVAWIDQACCEYGIDEPFRLLVANRSGQGEPRLLARGFTRKHPGGSVSSLEEMDFELSTTSIAIRRQEQIASWSDVYDDTFLRFGGRDGRRPVVSACRGGSRVPYAVADERLLFVDGCGSATRSIVLLDRRTSERRTVAVLADQMTAIGDVALTGDFAAYSLYGRDGADEVVVVRLAGGTTHRVLTAPAPAPSRFDLDAVGRLAVVASKPGRSGPSCADDYELSWYSAAEPFAHKLPAEACPGPIAWAGERIAYAGDPTVNASRSQLRTVGLGSDEQLAVDAGRVGLYSFDADERHLAYGLAACDGGIDLFALPLTERAPRLPASCPTRLASRAVQVRGRRALVKLACPRGCSGTIRIFRRGRKVSRDPYFEQAGPRVGHSVRIPTRIQRLVAARGRIAAHVRIRSTNRTLLREITDVTRRVTLVRAAPRE